MGEKKSMAPGQMMVEPKITPKPEDYPVRPLELPKNATPTQKLIFDLRQDYIQKGHYAIAYLLPDSALLNVEIYFKKNEYHDGMKKDEYLTTVNKYLDTSKELIYEDHIALNEYARNSKKKPEAFYLVVEGEDEATRMLKARQFVILFTPAFGNGAFGKPVELNEKNAKGKEKELIERLETRQEWETSRIPAWNEKLNRLQNAQYPLLTKDPELKKILKEGNPLLLDELKNLYMLEALLATQKTPGMSKEEQEKNTRKQLEEMKRKKEENDAHDLAIAGILAAVVAGLPSQRIPPVSEDITKIIDDLNPGDKWWENKAKTKEIQAAVLAQIKAEGAPKVQKEIIKVDFAPSQPSQEKLVEDLAEELNKLNKLKADADKLEKEIKGPQ